MSVPLFVPHRYLSNLGYLYNAWGPHRSDRDHLDPTPKLHALSALSLFTPTCIQPILRSPPRLPSPSVPILTRRHSSWRPPESSHGLSYPFPSTCCPKNPPGLSLSHRRPVLRRRCGSGNPHSRDPLPRLRVLSDMRAPHLQKDVPCSQISYRYSCHSTAHKCRWTCSDVGKNPSNHPSHGASCHRQSR